MSERARQVCQKHGLMLIERGVSLELLSNALRGMGNFSSDILLADACKCAAILGSEKSCQDARDELCIKVPDPIPQLTGDDIKVEAPSFDGAYIQAFSVMHPGIREFADNFIRSFRNAGANNYLSHKFTDGETGERYEMVIQKVTGKTPTDRVKELEAQLIGGSA